MKKTLTFIIILAFVANAYAQKLPKSETKTAIATYDGFSDVAYFFTNTLDNSPMTFEKAKDDVLKKYNLRQKEFLKEAFRITYTVKYEKTLPQSTKPVMAKQTIIDLYLLENYNDNPDEDGGE